jgi:hypothetical protein
MGHFMTRLNRYIVKKVASVMPAFMVWTRKEQVNRIEFRVEGHVGKPGAPIRELLRLCHLPHYHVFGVLARYAFQCYF